VPEITSRERQKGPGPRRSASIAPPKGCKAIFEFVLNLIFVVIIDWFVFFRRKEKVPE
jgi:hypothetical protein